MKRRRAALLALVLVGLVAGGTLWWRARAGTSAAGTAGSGAGGAGGLHGIRPDRAGDVPAAVAWLAQPGLAPRRIAGRVTHAGSPVAGAHVRAENEATRAGLLPIPEVTTGADGRFDLGVLPPLVYEVTAQAAKLAPSGARVDLRDPTARPPADALELVLDACTASLHGRVRDVSGGIVAGAAVRAYSGWGAASTRADTEGSYELCVTPGELVLEASADGYGRAFARASARRRTERDLALTPEAIIEGQVVRAEGGAPVVGALVSAGRVSVLSGADGRFALAGLRPGRYAVAARADGLAMRSAIEVQVRVGQPGEEIVCRLEAMLRVTGHVLEGKQAVAGARVMPQVGGRPGGGEDWSGLPDAVTQADGSFAIDGLPAVEITFAVRDHEVLEPDFAVVDAQHTDVTLQVKAMARIRGRVTQGGQPVANANVYVRQEGAALAYGRTGGDGRYELTGLEVGTYGVGADSEALGAFAADKPVVLAGGEIREGVDLELDLAGQIAGTVVDERGAPVAGVFVSFSLVGGADWGRDQTTADGSFVARGLSGGGDYEPEVRPSEDSPATMRPARGTKYPRVAVRDGTTQVSGVRITVALERLAIGGRVVDAAGAPVPDLEVEAIRTEDRFENGGYERPSAEVTSDDDGRFRLDGLLAGTYLVRANDGAGGSFEVPEVAAGRLDVVVRVPAPGRIEGTLEGFSGAARVDAYGPGFGRFRARVSGAGFTFEGLPPGEYHLTASAGALAATGDATVVAKQTARVTLHAAGSARVNGRVVDVRTGAPLAGRVCGVVYAPGTDLPTARSDADGRFVVDVAAGVELAVGCSPRDWMRESAAAKPLELRAGETIEVKVEMVVRSERGPRGWLGVEVDGGDRALSVLAVVPRTPAAAAGIVAGDVLIRVDDVPVEGLGGWGAGLLISDRPIGGTVRLGISRAGVERALVVALAARPAGAGWDSL